MRGLLKSKIILGLDREDVFIIIHLLKGQKDSVHEASCKHEALILYFRIPIKAVMTLQQALCTNYVRVLLQRGDFSTLQANIP